MSVVLSPQLLYFWVNSTGCSSEFYAVFEYFEDLKVLILNILKEKLIISYYILLTLLT